MKLVSGGSEVTIALYDEGNQSGPTLLFVHGFSQAALCWCLQRNSDLARNFRIVSVDMRGHGGSTKPSFAGAYDNHTPFAEDLNGVMNFIGDGPVVVVCWSMGGNWICDYIRDYGDKRLAGILLVGATTQQGTEVTQRFFGAGATDNLEGLFDSDPAINIAATKAFLRACTAATLPPDEFSDILAYNMMVSHEARWWMLNRISDNNDVLGSLSIPIMQIHGTADAIVYPFASRYTLDHIKHDRKELKLYKDVGHSPFYEAPDRFNSDLRYFANKVFSV